MKRAAANQHESHRPTLVTPFGDAPGDVLVAPAHLDELGAAGRERLLSPAQPCGEGSITDADCHAPAGMCEGHVRDAAVQKRQHIAAVYGRERRSYTGTSDTDELLKLLAKLVVRILNEQEGNAHPQDGSTPVPTMPATGP